MTETCASRIVSGEPATIARRYATALYKLAEEQGQMDAVVSDVNLLRDLLDTNDDFRRVVANVGLAPGAQAAVIRKMAETGKVSPAVASFLAVLCEKKRLSLLCPIVSMFKADLALRRGDFTAQVVSAKPLTEVQTQKLASDLGKKLGGKVEILVKQDPSLLGGLTVQLGSLFVDASIKGKLAQLEKKLKSQQEAA